MILGVAQAARVEVDASGTERAPGFPTRPVETEVGPIGVDQRGGSVLGDQAGAGDTRRSGGRSALGLGVTGGPTSKALHLSGVLCRTTIAVVEGARTLPITSPSGPRSRGRVPCRRGPTGWRETPCDVHLGHYDCELDCVEGSQIMSGVTGCLPSDGDVVFSGHRPTVTGDETSDSPVMSFQPTPPIVSPMLLHQFLCQMCCTVPISHLEGGLSRTIQRRWLERAALAHDHSVLPNILSLQHRLGQKAVRDVFPILEGLVNALGNRWR